MEERVPEGRERSQHVNTHAGAATFLKSLEQGVEKLVLS
jgi:hypothetical protein